MVCDIITYLLSTYIYHLLGLWAVVVCKKFTVETSLFNDVLEEYAVDGVCDFML